MVIYGAAALIGHAFADEPLNHGDDLGDVLGRPGMYGGRTDAQRLCVPVVLRNEAVAQLLDVTPSSLARLIILSSISVKFCTKRTL